MRRNLFIILTISVVGLIGLGIGWYRYSQPLQLKPMTFSHLPGWQNADPKLSLQAFKQSCSVFLKQAPDTSVGSAYLTMTAQDWQPVCQALLQVDMRSAAEARQFFQTWFVPVAFYQHRPVQGLFTGYYLPLLHGSLTRSKRYHVPVYRMPDNLVTVDLGQFNPEWKDKRIRGRVEGQKFLPYHTREAIDHGALDGHASVLVWVDNPIDRLFLEIQGSGVVLLDDGSKLFVGYAGQNGAPYTAIGQVLIKKGVMDRKHASMQAIKAYLQAHPDEINDVLNQNKSFVFFDTLRRESAIGSQGIELTTGYSLAVDRQWIPMGVPIWLNTTRPAYHSDEQLPFQRLMIAQDTGGAIRGMVRGDVYWGAGERATAIAGRMKNNGYYWLLLPHAVVDRLNQHQRLG